MISSLVMVDLCLVGSEGDIFKTVDTVRPDIIALGYDQVHQEKFIVDGCKSLKLDVKVARLQSPIPEISSFQNRKRIRGSDSRLVMPVGPSCNTLRIFYVSNKQTQLYVFSDS
ncbi:hypothetical protein QVH35_07150 [Candidatus Nitrosotenuis chungbukensis]|uniref:hypothetical protein n=1 Tax=Candidatus Nitrosotenuis chungbukensis TaxID=1353246 RepID=UPI0026717294|nr:hypothetical protein [Candidatus Nitrosotenuis chungbukensis]WKT57209.1 hypothetical protein QVH35_07150 [Candidatus Nitrosotenuis chungbukensis]